VNTQVDKKLRMKLVPTKISMGYQGGQRSGKARDTHEEEAVPTHGED
jgi:hypothetical protein